MRRFVRERQTQPGGVDRGADLAPPLVGHHEVVEHPHRDFMRSPGSHQVLRATSLDSAAARERIQQHWRICAEVTDHEVARQADAGERDPGSASDFDVHHGQQYR